MATALETIDAGENLPIAITVKDANGDPMALADVAEASFWLVNDKPALVVKRWTYINPSTFSADIEADGDTLRMELLSTETHTPGNHTLFSRVRFADADYVTSGSIADVVTTLLFLKIDATADYGLALTSAPEDSEAGDGDTIVDGDGSLLTDGGDIITD